MARYGQAFKDRAVARLLPPESSAVADVAREVGINLQTLERWRIEALTGPARDRVWTAAARLEGVIVTAALNDAQRSAWSDPRRYLCWVAHRAAIGGHDRRSTQNPRCGPPPAQADPA